MLIHKITSVDALPDFKLALTFQNGEKKSYDVSTLFDELEVFQAFQLTPRLFEQAQVAAGGYGVVWNDELDLACDELYENGVPLTTP
jgi:hypothetical protein